MKQKDIALIVIVVFVSALISLFASKALFAPPKNRQQKVEVVQPISAQINKPDSRYFNGQAFDPAQSITTGGNANPDPFSGSSAQ